MKLTVQDRVKIVRDVDKLIFEGTSVEKACEKLHIGGRDRYFDSRKWLINNGYRSKEGKWADKASAFIQPDAGLQKDYIAANTKAPDKEIQVFAVRNNDNAVLDDRMLGSDQVHGREGHLQDHGREGLPKYKYPGRSGSARIFITIGQDVYDYIKEIHELSGMPMASIAANLLFKGYMDEIGKN